MLKIVATVILTTVAALPAAAQQPPAGEPTEHLLVNPPPGWTAQPVTAKGPVRASQLFPAGQSANDYVEKIILMRDANPGAPPPKQFVSGLVQAAKNGCEGTQIGDLDETPINGYAAAGVRLACTKGRQTGKSGLMLIAAIRGKDALYTVQRMWLGAPVAPHQTVPVPPAVLAEWAAFTRLITLCDPRTPEHPCPKR